MCSPEVDLENMRQRKVSPKETKRKPNKTERYLKSTCGGCGSYVSGTKGE